LTPGRLALLAARAWPAPSCGVSVVAVADIEGIDSRSNGWSSIPAFNTQIDDLPDFPFTKLDPLIVPRRNPVDAHAVGER
jgi:hypothetical protein